MATPLYAMSGVERSGAARTGAHSAKVFLSIAGTERAHNRTSDESKVLIKSLRTTETQNSPTTGSCQTMGFAVSAGQEVICRMGSINNSERVFGGYVLSTDQGFAAAKPAHRQTALRLIDYTWLLDHVKIIGRFSGPADVIVTTLMTDNAPDWDLTHVESGLDPIDEITFIEPVTLSTALTRIADRIGATWRDYNYSKQLYFGVTAPIALTNPVTLTTASKTLRLQSFGPVKRDRSQQITRMLFEGGGGQAATDVEPGETILPLTDALDTWYGDVGGVVVSGPQRISYTGRFPGGGGSLVGPGAAPASAPTLALAAGSGVTAGTHGVTVVFETASGTTKPGPEATIVVGSVLAPATAPTVGTPQGGVGPDAGVHYYAITEVTAAGETTASPVSADVTTTVLDPPVGVWTIGNGIGTAGGSWAIGDTLYIKPVYLSAGGATTPGPQSASWVATADPLNPTQARSLAVVTQASTNPVTTGIRIYVNKNASWIGYYTGDLPNQSSTFYVSTTFTAGSPPASNTAQVAAIPLSDLAPASVLGTSRNLYGTAAGGSQLKFVAALNTTDTTYLVVTPDASLGANVPTSNTAAAAQITAGFSLGPSGTTARRLYMSPSTGGARKLALTVSNNTDITGTITASDATLAAAGAEPATDTSGLAQPTGQVVAGSTSIPVAGLGGANGFQSTGGWAIIGNGQHAVRYTSIVSNALSGIPASGYGSLPATIAYGSSITAAPALIGIGDTRISQSTTGGSEKLLRAATGLLTDRLGQRISVPRNVSVASLVLKMKRLGAVTGNIWVTLQTGSIDPTGVVLGTSALVDASTVPTSAADITFVLPPTHLQAGTAYIVLHGDYTRSDSVAITWWGDSSFSSNLGAYQYDGSTVIGANPIDIFIHNLTAVSQAITDTIHRGDPVNLLVTIDDLDAQASLSALLDPTDLLQGRAGIIEDYRKDERLSLTETRARAQARLSQRVREAVSLEYQTSDKNTHTDRTVIADLVAPTSVHETLKLQQVVRTWFESNPPAFPVCQVTASNELFTFEQLLNQGRS